jgi:hypothetical protein
MLVLQMRQRELVKSLALDPSQHTTLKPSYAVAVSHCMRWMPALQTLPREMVLSHALDPSQVKQIWSPAEPADVPEPVHINK